ncbi:hypothetical protein GOP47_0027817 [Adiantum capillus-veneris]|nr:hypothetical protein GOP47_0027817 [Adiantum capillus-veneris]
MNCSREVDEIVIIFEGDTRPGVMQSHIKDKGTVHDSPSSGAGVIGFLKGTPALMQKRPSDSIRGLPEAWALCMSGNLSQRHLFTSNRSALLSKVLFISVSVP